MTEQAVATGAQAAPSRAPRARGGPDRVTVALLSLTAFLLVLALLGSQLSHAGATHAPPRTRAVLLRRVYRTTVVERILPAGSGGPSGGTSVSQSESGPAGPLAPPAAPVTRTS